MCFQGVSQGGKRSYCGGGVVIKFKRVIDHQQESFGGPAFSYESSIHWCIAVGCGSVNSEAVHVQQP